jgi:hypothetical protein
MFQLGTTRNETEIPEMQMKKVKDVKYVTREEEL